MDPASASTPKSPGSTSKSPGSTPKSPGSTPKKKGDKRKSEGRGSNAERQAAAKTRRMQESCTRSAFTDDRTNEKLIEYITGRIRGCEEFSLRRFVVDGQETVIPRSMNGNSFMEAFQSSSKEPTNSDLQRFLGEGADCYSQFLADIKTLDARLQTEVHRHRGAAYRDMFTRWNVILEGLEGIGEESILTFSGMSHKDLELARPAIEISMGTDADAFLVRFRGKALCTAFELWVNHSKKQDELNSVSDDDVGDHKNEECAGPPDKTPPQGQGKPGSESKSDNDGDEEGDGQSEEGAKVIASHPTEGQRDPDKSSSDSGSDSGSGSDSDSDSGSDSGSPAV